MEQRDVRVVRVEQDDYLVVLREQADGFWFASCSAYEGCGAGGWSDREVLDALRRQLAARRAGTWAA